MGAPRERTIGVPNQRVSTFRSRFSKKYASGGESPLETFTVQGDRVVL